MLRSAARGVTNFSGILSFWCETVRVKLLKPLSCPETGRRRNSLTAEWGNEALYGGQGAIIYARDDAERMLKAASLEVIAERGVRVMADCFPTGFA